MNDNDNVKENFENVKDFFEKLTTTELVVDLDMAKLKADLKEKFKNYEKTIKYMLADAPIQVLCLPTAIENILLDNGFLRVYDLFDANFVEIKGLGVARIRHLTACFDKFISML